MSSGNLFEKLKLLGFTEGVKYLHKHKSVGEVLFPEVKFSDQVVFDDDLTDVSLFVGKYEIRCHKLILTTESNVFRKMFSTDMKEKRLSMVQIEDVNLQDLRSFLLFMYMDKLEESKITPGLLTQANRYEVWGLNTLCVTIFPKKLNLNNVVEIWYSAYLNDAKSLEEDAIAFMSRNQAAFQLFQST